MGPSCHWDQLETWASEARHRKDSHYRAAKDISPSQSGPTAPVSGCAGTPFPTLSVTTTPANPELLENPACQVSNITLGQC